MAFMQRSQVADVQLGVCLSRRRRRARSGRDGARHEASRFVPQGEPSERLSPFRHNVRLRLRRDEAASAIAADLAALHQVLLADAFVQSIENESASAGDTNPPRA
jgi:hypothetical protein